MSVEKKKLNRDAKIAEKELRPFVKSLCGHFQLWNILSSAKIMSEAFARDFNSLSYESKLAYSKAIIVDYAKPWSGNNSKPLKSLIDDVGNIPFLEPIIINSDVHKELRELRDRLVAHIDHNFEGLGVSIRGSTLENNPQAIGTIEGVFFPVSVVIESSGGIWWIDDLNSIENIDHHIQRCIFATQSSLSQTAMEFRNKCLEHAHVLNKLGNLFSLRELEKKDTDIANDINAHYDNSSISNDGFDISERRETKFGSNRIQSLLGRYEPAANLPSTLDLVGKGYRVILKGQTGESPSFNIFFPKYPHPKERN